MPKEQGGHFGERAARSTSKNAKDKSNSATLRASQTGKADLTNRMLRCDSEKDSEKDSGYSEAGSDSVNTDVDDQRSSASELQRKSTGTSSSDSVNGRNMPPYKEMTPVYVIKNVMVKPSRPDQLLHSPLAWGGAWHGLTGAKGPTQLLLIQQPSIPAPSSAPVAPSQNHPKKGTGRSNQAHKNSYLPILNSYPRIAPHPRKESHESKGGSRAGSGKESGSEGQSRSKRVCTEEEKREAVSTTTHLLKPQQKDVRVHSYSQHKSRSSHHSTTGQAHSTTQSKSHHQSQQRSSSDGISSPSVSSSQTPSPPCSSDSPSSSSSPSSSAAHSPYRPNPDSTSMRQRRFFNTAEILNQSGLLAITLRTKELLKQNAATEREIAQLRQHTQYLCQAAQASQTGSNESAQSLEKLVQAMSDSGSYPELDLNQLKALGDQQSRGKDDGDKNKANPSTNAMPAVISLHNIDDGTSPPSPLFAPSPEAEATEHADAVLEDSDQARRSAVTDKGLGDLMMLPESSTRNDYLL